MLRKTASRLIQYVGGTKLADLPAEWQAPVDSVLQAQEAGVSAPFHFVCRNTDYFWEGLKDYKG